MVVFDFFEEYPKLIHFRMASGSIPPPSSANKLVDQAENYNQKSYLIFLSSEKITIK